MTVHASRLARGHEPRRSLAALSIAVVGLAIGLSLALRSPSPGPGAPRPHTSPVSAQGIRVSVPQGFRTYDVRGGFYQAGGQPPLIGFALANFVAPRYVSTYGLFAGQWVESGPPSHGVALEFELDVAKGPAPAVNLHLPLTLNQPWFEQKHYARSGGKRYVRVPGIGYRFGAFRFRNAIFQVFYWSGADAPANDRAAVRRALKSIRPAR